MKVKHISSAVVFFTTLCSFIIPLRFAEATGGRALPEFSDFVASVRNGQAGVVRGVYAPGVLAFPVYQQDENDPGYVSDVDGVVTQFDLAARNKVIGLLAHNTLAGASFTNLAIGQEVRIVYGDGKVAYFIVNQLNRFQALPRKNQIAGYLDLSTDKLFNTQDIFSMFYQGGIHVTFQTCIKKGDETSWGRLFITAIPVPPTFFAKIQKMNLTRVQASRGAIKSFDLLQGNALMH
jgi:hypothetical protein